MLPPDFYKRKTGDEAGAKSRKISSWPAHLYFDDRRNFSCAIFFFFLILKSKYLPTGFMRIFIFKNSVYDALGTILRWWIASGEYFYNRRLIGVSLLFLLTTFNFAERTFATFLYSPRTPAVRHAKNITWKFGVQECVSGELQQFGDFGVAAVCVCCLPGIRSAVEGLMDPSAKSLQLEHLYGHPHTQRSRLRAARVHVSTVWTFDSSP
jgi:hypothetical protein